MSAYQATISNEEVIAMEVRGFEGEILVVDSAQTMLRAEGLLVGEPILGFDTETRPAFSKGQSYQLALLQLSTRSVAMLFRVQVFPLSSFVIEILQSRDVLKIGAAVPDDIKALNKIAPFSPAGFVDLQNIVGNWGIEQKSVRKMAAIVLGFKVSKAQRLSNWEVQSLTSAQADYAATDAWVCREIYCQLKQCNDRD